MLEFGSGPVLGMASGHDPEPVEKLDEGGERLDPLPWAFVGEPADDAPEDTEGLFQAFGVAAEPEEVVGSAAGET